MKKVTKETTTATKYNKISNEIKKEIKIRYECGEPMFNLSYEFKVNLGTLRNCASREKWKKGRLKDIILKREEELITEEIIQERKIQDIIHKNLHKAVLNGLNNRIQTGGNGKYIQPGDKKDEEATLLLLKTIINSRDMYAKMYNVRTEVEEVDYKLKLLEFERAQRQLTKEEQEFFIE